MLVSSDLLYLFSSGESSRLFRAYFSVGHGKFDNRISITVRGWDFWFVYSTFNCDYLIRMILNIDFKCFCLEHLHIIYLVLVHIFECQLFSNITLRKPLLLCFTNRGFEELFIYHDHVRLNFLWIWLYFLMPEYLIIIT